MRSRQKRKCWVSNLEAKLMAVNNTNKLLQSEVVTLRSELAQFDSLYATSSKHEESKKNSNERVATTETVRTQTKLLIHLL